MALNVYCKIIVIIALLICMYHQKLSECVCVGGGGGWFDSWKHLPRN